MSSKKFSKPPTNNSLITHFFENGNSAEIQISKEKKTDNPVGLYERCLQNSYDQSCKNEICARKKEELRVRLVKAKAKTEQLEKANATAKIICEEKDGEIAVLQGQLHSFAAENSSSVQIDCAEASEQNVRFTEFSAEFSNQQMQQIRSVGTPKTEDSRFILEITRSLYSEDMEKLCSVSLTGRGKNGSKQPISPKKMQMLTSMFTERINGLPKKQLETEMKTDADERMKSLNPGT